ncbi:hypothetical protein LZ31DRAFT_549265, partial [Colletotrichum somersetense]
MYTYLPVPTQVGSLLTSNEVSTALSPSTSRPSNHNTQTAHNGHVTLPEVARRKLRHARPKVLDQGTYFFSKAVGLRCRKHTLRGRMACLTPTACAPRLSIPPMSTQHSTTIFTCKLPTSLVVYGERTDWNGMLSALDPRFPRCRDPSTSRLYNEPTRRPRRAGKLRI